jgi:hypothetical protein
MFQKMEVTFEIYWKFDKVFHPMVVQLIPLEYFAASNTTFENNRHNHKHHLCYTPHAKTFF